MGVNKVICVGHVGSDPQVRYLPAGGQVCNFSVAVNESFTDKQGKKQERTEWMRVSAWARLAEACGEYLSKGRQVYVEGRMKTSEREVDGHKRQYVEVVAQVVEFLGSPKDAGQARQGDAPRGQSKPRTPQQVAPDGRELPPMESYGEEEIPF